jgi:hypothetical protein
MPHLFGDVLVENDEQVAYCQLKRAEVSRVLLDVSCNVCEATALRPYAKPLGLQIDGLLEERKNSAVVAAVAAAFACRGVDLGWGKEEPRLGISGC